MGDEPLAHSAPAPGRAPQLYKEHIQGVVVGALDRAEAMLCFCKVAELSATLRGAIRDATTFHDLGKLDPDIQAALRRGRGEKLCWDHIDAGVAHLKASGAHLAAWLVRAHHAPGLPSQPFHFTHKTDRRLRGRRNDGDTLERHQGQIERTDRLLKEMLGEHERALGPHQPTPAKAKEAHGLPMRLALSCLVDADHADSARFDNSWEPAEPPPPRWRERLAALDAYVVGLGERASSRNSQRDDFYRDCRHGELDAAMVACEGPVGIGKTTAVTAYLLRRAISTGARRLIIVAPYTAILSQTARKLREALVLPDEAEQAETVVAEHHHRADFNDLSSRDLAALWTAPVVLTTAVQFFGTLASNEPSALRKLNALPGSVVFLDESHAALPNELWPQNWRWLRELAAVWGCSFVFASGSLARFWEIEDVVGEKDTARLPDLVSPELSARMLQGESARVRYVAEPRPFSGPGSLTEAVAAADGPRLLIMNTVQSAAVMARRMRNEGHDVLHMSTALSPSDRSRVLELVQQRLDPGSGYSADWTLVATSLMEAGVDVSFRTPFRERFATASLIQIGGRANRNAEWPDGVLIYDFVVDDDGSGLKPHPAARVPADVLRALFAEGRLAGQVDPAAIVTEALQREIRDLSHKGETALAKAERTRNYPDVAECGRVIDTDTRLVVVDHALKHQLTARKRVPVRKLLAGSVQIWAHKLDQLGLDPVPGRADVWWWPHEYDANFLGYMAGALKLLSIQNGATFIV